MKFIGPRKTFGKILEEHDGAGPGFDLLRLSLAIAILMSHVVAVGETRGFFPELMQMFLHLLGHAQSHASGASAVATADQVNSLRIPFGRPFAVSHVPMFFALSGFLVAGSALRTKRLFPFLALRFFRIFPALCVEVVLSAVVIGGIFSTLPFEKYYSSQGFLTYFGNIVGIVQMELPGVLFSSGDPVAVNANLWTLPSEFHSYLALALLMVTGIAFKRGIFTSLFVVVTAALLVSNIFFDYNAKPFILAGDINVYYFYVGAIFYVWRDRIPYAFWLFIPCVVCTYLLMFSTHAVYLVPIMLTYVTVFLGLTAFPTNRLLRSGDYSYGIYLYGFPITQVLASSFPALRHNYLGLVFSAILGTSLFAMLSWHLIEKRFLRLRKYFSPKSAKIAEELHPEPVNLLFRRFFLRFRSGEKRT